MTNLSELRPPLAANAVTNWLLSSDVKPSCSAVVTGGWLSTSNTTKSELHVSKKPICLHDCWNFFRIVLVSAPGFVASDQSTEPCCNTC